MNTRTLHPSPLRKYICNPAHPLIGGIGVLTIAIALTLTACGEKKKPDGGEVANTPTPAEAESGNTFTDSRDGKAYKTVKIGEQVWMAENLNYNASGSKCYDNNETNCAKYGRLYDWKTAMKACPSGWHLPSHEEWNKLYRFADGNANDGRNFYRSETASKYLKTIEGWNDYEGKSGNGEDKLGFSALPGGIGFIEKAEYRGDYRDVGKNGRWWSSIECFELETSSAHNIASLNSSSKNIFLLSVRCLLGDADYNKVQAAFNASNTIKFVRTVEFNNEKIPITVYYYHLNGSDQLESNLDSLVFNYLGKKHTIDGSGSYKFSSEKHELEESIQVGDFNFDNYMDIAITTVINGDGGEGKKYFIYNPQTKNYHYNEELFAPDNVEFNSETQTVTATYYDEEGTVEKKFKWSDGKLVEKKD